MTLENQVCSLELAKKLKELGVKQESHFRWIDNELHGFDDVKNYGYEEQWGDKKFWKYGISAFTVAELGEMLPWALNNKTPHKSLGLISGRCNGYWLHYRNPSSNTYLPDGVIEADVEADARAKMLIYLIENKVISV